jgi:hypothetical protein
MTGYVAEVKIYEMVYYMICDGIVCWYVKVTLLSHVPIRSQDCVVGIMSRVEATNNETVSKTDPPKPGGLTRPDRRGEKFFAFQNVQTDSGVHSAFYAMCNGRYLTCDKDAVA